jgi:hypothetical protein
VLLLPKLADEVGIGVRPGFSKSPMVNLTPRIRRTASSMRLIGMVPFCTSGVRPSMNSV